MAPILIHTGIWGGVGLLLAGSALCWVLAIRRAQAGLELVPWTPRRPVPWGLVDVGACFVLLIIFDAASLQMAGLTSDVELLDLSPPQQTRALLAMAVGRLAAAALSLLILTIRTSSRAHDTGVTLLALRSDVLLGVTAFLMIAPLIYLLQNGLSRVWPEGSHPLVEMVRNTPTFPLFGAACATAVIAAPLAEEFLLRVVFQGWLEKVAVWRGPTSDLLAGGTIEWEPHGHEEHPRSSLDRLALASRPPFWPVVVSSLLFALMHLQKEPSPDPIPLFFFALALGFLYQRTHRLLPCVVMHTLLNTSSMTILALSVWRPDWLPLQ